MYVADVICVASQGSGIRCNSAAGYLKPRFRTSPPSNYHKKKFRVVGFRVLGFRVVGFRVLGCGAKDNRAAV